MRIYKNINAKKSLYSFAFRNQFDVISNEISKDIFNAVISGQPLFFQSYPYYRAEIEAIISKTTDKLTTPYDNFEIKPYNGGYFDENKKFYYSVIDIGIKLSNDFSKLDYEKLNYVLYEVVRHEIEHVNTYNKVGMPKEEYTNLFNDVHNEDENDLRVHCQKVSDYILHAQELPSYAKSLYYYAKKSKKSFVDVIDVALKRSFFNNDPDKIRESMDDKIILKLFVDTKNALINQIKMYNK